MISIIKQKNVGVAGFEPHDKNPQLLTKLLTPNHRIDDQIYNNISMKNKSRYFK